ncbi:MAG TPA: amino acid racemase [Salinimicrobium sp.]|nr:amino acid racemase [Salinimicrobium sp.]
MIGIVGGIGPYSGADLLRKIFDNTIARMDQEHLDVLLFSLPSKIADRTEFLEGQTSSNPGVEIAGVISNLSTAGATIIGIPCNTAHCDEILKTINSEIRTSGIKIRVLNMIEETASHISETYPEINKIGILSTTGTYKAGIYLEALHKKKMDPITPPADIQEEYIHPAIYDPDFGIKAHPNPIHPKAREYLMHGISCLKKERVNAIILGCSEIPLAIPERETEGILFFDPTEILARSLIREHCPEKLKPFK